MYSIWLHSTTDCNLCPRSSFRRRPVRTELRPRDTCQQLLSPWSGRGGGEEEEEENQREEEGEKEQREEENGGFWGGSGEEEKERIWPLKVGE